MKTFQFKLGKLLITAIVCSLAAGATVQAGQGSRDAGDSRLVVRRVADFGTAIFLLLYVDGVQVTTLGRGAGYEATLRPGRHTISVGTTPSPYGKTRRTHRDLVMNGGQTYSYTALWQWADWVILDDSLAARRAQTHR